ncbi:hypothetical protein C2E23DRAFT_889546 [Lenzites betulinus]|nr:hypothetical protein C2E23DRAFT_889546 [Lenzites betulinus]
MNRVAELRGGPPWPLSSFSLPTSNPIPLPGPPPPSGLEEVELPLDIVECHLEQTSYPSSVNLLDAYEMAPTTSTRPDPTDTFIDRVLHLAIVSSYVAYNVNTPEDGDDPQACLQAWMEMIRRAVSCLEEEAARIAYPGTPYSAPFPPPKSSSPTLSPPTLLSPNPASSRSIGQAWHVTSSAAAVAPTETVLVRPVPSGTPTPACTPLWSDICTCHVSASPAVSASLAVSKFLAVSRSSTVISSSTALSRLFPAISVSPASSFTPRPPPLRSRVVRRSRDVAASFAPCPPRPAIFASPASSFAPRPPPLRSRDVRRSRDVAASFAPCPPRVVRYVVCYVGPWPPPPRHLPYVPRRVRLLRCGVVRATSPSRSPPLHR